MSTAADTDQQPVPDEVVEFCVAGGYGAVVGVEVLLGGMASSVRRLSTASGARLVVKQGADLPADPYPLEADGLAALAGAEPPRLPRVHAVGAGYLMLEDLGPVPSAEPPAPDWAAFGRGLARQHQHRSARFGYDTDTYLGQQPQRKPVDRGRHEFFATHSLLRYLPEPKSEQSLTAADRAAVERIARRLPDLVPAAPPSLLHGDLWHANMLPATPYGPAFIDPAVHYGWPEVDLSMAHRPATSYRRSSSRRTPR